MNKFISFLKDAVTSDNCVSSKRIAGLMGWIVCLVLVIYCSIATKEAPGAIDTLFVCSTSLLGLDSITNAFKKKQVDE